MKRGNKRVFGREMQQRKAFIKGLLTALIAHGKIRTTTARAKTKTEADKLVTQAKRGTIAGRRLLMRKVGTEAATKMFKEVAPKFADRAGDTPVSSNWTPSVRRFACSTVEFVS